MRFLISLLAGALFGTGLLISGMTDTTKVQGWLDVFGQWDPTLAFVMGGAIVPMLVAWRLTANRRPLNGGYFPQKSAPDLGRRLIFGSVLFGMGWGLAGLCPGPALASLSYGGIGGFVFLIAMIAGMVAAPTLGAQLDRAANAA
ncbi:putative transporter component [Ruegeria denitrificans]|uniref:Putative transporter component n=1 Tax=Ruegeria denitrificans TaxID=1715692 RepID=A0A0P1IL92_9RHOB|nr:DUF6691 family protein [Ruegeria denitrificans]CUK05621.1 putative transporter component [Ruegeria denitrificans]